MSQKSFRTRKIRIQAKPETTEIASKVLPPKKHTLSKSQYTRETTETAMTPKPTTRPSILVLLTANYMHLLSN